MKAENYRLSNTLTVHCTQRGGREDTTQSMKLIINEHYCFHMNGVEITGLVFKEREGG